MKLSDTPIERHEVKGRNVYVKREDTCAVKYPYAPTFSKVRGLAGALKKIADLGFKQVGYVETSVSMAGWGVAWLAREYGLEPVIFDPQYKLTPKRLELEPHLKVLEFHRLMWKMFDARVIPIAPGRAKVNYYVARRWINGNAKDKMTLLPLGLPLTQTKLETARIARQVDLKNHYNTVVVNVGSGTICAGLLTGFAQDSVPRVIGVLGRKSDVKAKRRRILTAAGLYPDGLIFQPDFDLIQSKYEYTEPSAADCPFPIHPYYDLKAWEWLVDNIDELESPILFWNIGSLPKEI